MVSVTTVEVAGDLQQLQNFVRHLRSER